MPNLKLIKATHEFVDDAWEMMTDSSDTMGIPQGMIREEFPKYLDQLIEMEHGQNLPESWVPMTTFWLVKDETEAIGIGRLRHRLNDHLREDGGHIGCLIHSAFRGQGYGTQLLSLMCDEALKIGLERVLVNCLITNEASIGIIEKNGGVRESRGVDEAGEPTYLYWIDLTK